MRLGKGTDRGSEPGRLPVALFTVSGLLPEAERRLGKRRRIVRVVLLDGAPSAAGLPGVPASAWNQEALRALCQEWIEEAVFLPPEGTPLPSALMDRLLALGFAVSYPEAAAGARRGGNTRRSGRGAEALRVEYPHRVRPWQAAVKRAADIVGGLLGCVVTAALCVVIAPAIVLADPGPVFFTQERVGKNGRRIRVHKFRSMVRGAEERLPELMDRNEMHPHMMFKLSDDPRVIGSGRRDRKGRPRGLGHFLRRTSLDEFPQFFDCLMGRLSLVGWRPCTLPEWESYRPEHRIRACVPPGITGIWQVSGRNNIRDFDEIVRLERGYIERWSLAQDGRILLRTVPVVLTEDGAE